MRNGLTEVLDTWEQRKKNIHPSNQRAKVVAVTPTTAIVRVGGSQQTQEALLPSGSDVAVNDEVFLQPQNNSRKIRWIITAILAKNNTSGGISAVERQYAEIFPPSNVRQVDSVGGSVTIQWDVPITFPVTFQLQTDSDYAASADQVSVQTRGCYAIIDTGETSVDIRVRSVAPDGQKSGWTQWLTASPTQSSGSARGIIVTVDNEILIMDNWVVRYDSVADAFFTLE